MKLIVVAVMMLLMVCMAVSQAMNNRRQKAFLEEPMRIMPVILFSTVSVLLTDVLASGKSLSLYMTAVDMMPSVMAAWLVSSSFHECRWTRRILWVLSFFNVGLFIFHICRAVGFAEAFPDARAILLLSLAAAMIPAVSILVLIERIRDVKSLMRNGSVWAFICLAVDYVYLCFVVAGVAAVQVRCPVLGVMLLCGAVAAMGFRILTDSKFILWHEQERIIIESMKITSLPAASDVSRIDEVYKDLYDRVVAYFESEKPYLNSDLTINSIVKDLYSNKLYLSRTISQFTGRNFCQFVNYYRVRHAMESFRANPDFKVHELATMSGFNSIVSFNMAFRLFMGENPSEWCRKERAKLIKKPK